VVNIGDGADMPSLSGYDKGKRTFQGRTYRADIDAHLDFEEKLWNEVKKRKKKLPYRVYCMGNHDERILRATNLSPELEGAISISDLRLDFYYDDVVSYNGRTPGIIEIDGVCYAHYFTSGIMGNPISGEHVAYSLLTKQFTSCTAGHNHTLDFSVRTNPLGRKIMGLCCGCYQDYEADWAGETNKLWWRGVVIKRDVDKGCYNPEFISLEALKNEYN